MARLKKLMDLRCKVAVLVAGLICLIPSACTSPGKKPETVVEGKKSDADSKAKNDASSPVDVGFLLSMTFDEAEKISPASVHVLPNYHVAADSVKVTSKTADGQARRATVKGHVFLQIDFGDSLTALGQEALVGGNEVILRGKPLLKRGRTVVEGLEDATVFFIMGSRLQVVGKHRITTDEGVTPTWPKAWKEGPNPLLPALSPDDIPREMRASLLLPSLTDDDGSKPPR